MFCENCGKELKPGSRFCTNCGARPPEYPAETEPLTTAPPEPEMPAQEPAAPMPETPAPTQAPVFDAAPMYDNPADESLYQKIIYKNTDYYLSQFRNMRSGAKSKMNWASFFLTLYHAAYRNVWREWLRAVLWPLLVMLGSCLIATALFSRHWGVAIFFAVVAGCSNVWWIVANILFAKRFNRVYQEHVENKIAQQDFAPDPSGGRVVLAIVAYAVVSSIIGAIIGAFGFSSLVHTMDDIFDEDYSYHDDFTAYEPSDKPHDLPDGSDTIIGTDIYNYLGGWMVDSYSSFASNYIAFQLESNNDILCFTAMASWDHGDDITTIDTVSLDMNSKGTQAKGAYQDSRGNSGDVILDFENDGLYLTVTCRNSGNRAIVLQHEHCSRGWDYDWDDADGGWDYDWDDHDGGWDYDWDDHDDSALYNESGYYYYANGQTVSWGTNDVSSDYIGSCHLWPTDTLTITDYDLSVLTRTEVAEIRNEIFARHGYTFSSAQWLEYFNTAEWYQPDASFSADRLSSTEKQNVETITAYEKAKGWSS